MSEVAERFLIVAFIWLGGFLVWSAGKGLKSAIERRAARRTVERLIALEPASFISGWALPAPESYALLTGARNLKSDAFKLGLMQLIVMGVLAQDGSGAPESGGDTTLRRGPTPDKAAPGSLARIRSLWVSATEEGDKGPEGRGARVTRHADPLSAPSLSAHDINRRVHDIEKRGYR